MDNFPTFEERRHSDPQGVINDLLKQITAQAKAIHQKNIELGQEVTDGLSEAGKKVKQSKPKTGEETPAKKAGGKKDDSPLYLPQLPLQGLD